MSKYFTTAYKFGGLGGALSILAFFILSLFHPDPTSWNLIFGYVMTPIVVFLSIKFFKEYSNNRYLSFSEGMSIGFVTYTILAFLSALGIWVLLLLSPELFAQIKASKLEVLVNGKENIINQMGINSYEYTLDSLKNILPKDIALDDGIRKIVTGLFFTIIISIILRKTPN